MTDGSRFAARSGSASAGVRSMALLAAAALHILVFASLMLVTGIEQGGSGRPSQLTVVALPPPTLPPAPPSHAMAPGAGAATTNASAPRSSAPTKVSSEGLPLAVASAPAKQAEGVAEQPAVPLPPPPAPPAAAADTALRDYEAVIWRHIAAHKPRGVQVTGTVTVTFQLDQGGVVTALDVVQSSGNLNLDRIAQRTIRRSGPFPLPPAALAAGQLRFVIAVDFR